MLDHQGNSVKNKVLRAHSVAVNQISIDAKGDYIASCSDDGKVFILHLFDLKFYIKFLNSVILILL